MNDYFYILILTTIFVYEIVKGIYLFKKGKYNPYVLKKGEFEEPLLVRLGLNLTIFFCLTTIKSKHMIYYILLTYIFCMCACTNILSYLYYRKVKDKRIIFHTVVLDAILIIMAILLWKLK